jgi:hypothetical protein
MLTVCTILDVEDGPRARVLARAVRHHHPDARLVAAREGGTAPVEGWETVSTQATRATIPTMLREQLAGSSTPHRRYG